jgi:hypothetical protein
MFLKRINDNEDMPSMRDDSMATVALTPPLGGHLNTHMINTVKSMVRRSTILIILIL